MPIEALEILRREHRNIERALRALEGLCQHLEIEKPVAPEPLQQVLEFIRAYADRCHHAKEEEHLFPLLEERGIPRHGGPIGVMLHEHEKGRELVRRMGEAAEAYNGGNAAAGKVFAEAARAFIELLDEHIGKEENVLFPLAGRVLDAAAAADLTTAFRQAMEESGSCEHYERMAASLEAAWAIPVAPGKICRGRRGEADEQHGLRHAPPVRSGCSRDR